MMLLTRVFNSIEAGNLPITRELLEGNEEVDVDTLMYGRTPLHQACVHVKLEIVKYLIQEQNASVHTVDCDGWTPLYQTCYNGHKRSTEAARIGIAEFLLTNGADVNTKSSDSGETPLHQACYSGSTQLIQVLLNHGARIDATCNAGCTPLITACICPSIDVVKFLLDNKADCQIKDNRGRGPADRLRRHGLEEVIEAYDKRPLAVSGAANIRCGTTCKISTQDGTMVGINPSLSQHQHALAVKSILLVRQLPVHEVALEILGFLTPASVGKLFAV